jgi:hypothetical protein
MALLATFSIDQEVAADRWNTLVQKYIEKRDSTRRTKKESNQTLLQTKENL